MAEGPAIVSQAAVVLLSDIVSDLTKSNLKSTCYKCWRFVEEDQHHQRPKLAHSTVNSGTITTVSWQPTRSSKKQSQGCSEEADAISEITARIQREGDWNELVRVPITTAALRLNDLLIALRQFTSALYKFLRSKSPVTKAARVQRFLRLAKLEGDIKEMWEVLVHLSAILDRITKQCHKFNKIALNEQSEWQPTQMNR
jgi:hypothetical protein